MRPGPAQAPSRHGHLPEQPSSHPVFDRATRLNRRVIAVSATSGSLGRSQTWRQEPEWPSVRAAPRQLAPPRRRRHRQRTVPIRPSGAPPRPTSTGSNYLDRPRHCLQLYSQAAGSGCFAEHELPTPPDSGGNKHCNKCISTGERQANGVNEGIKRYNAPLCQELQPGRAPKCVTGGAPP